MVYPYKNVFLYLVVSCWKWWWQRSVYSLGGSWRLRGKGWCDIIPFYITISIVVL